MISIELPKEIDARLDHLARKTGRSKADHVREAVIEYLEDLEDAAIAEERLEAIREGRSRTYTIEEMEKALGLED